MAIRKIVKEGDEILSKRCKTVTAFDDRLKTLTDDMKDTLIDADGLGLAAPQVGVLKRAVVIIDDDKSIRVLINPEITRSSGTQEGHEGCLSVPGIFGITERPEKVTVTAVGINGKKFTITRTGMTAVCLCHELDHLDGILFRTHVKEYLDVDND